LRLETPVYRPSTRAPRRHAPWVEPVFVVILFLGWHSEHENWRRDRQLRDPVENGREQVPRHGGLRQLAELLLVACSWPLVPEPFSSSSTDALDKPNKWRIRSLSRSASPISDESSSGSRLTAAPRDRPDRYEPRLKKHRRNHYDWLTRPRAEMKRQMARGVATI